MKKFSILNSQFSIPKGFTLIELLVVMGVFLAVSAVVGGILFSTLRGSQKTTTLDEVRQNGNYALSTMAKNIRGGKLLSTCSDNMTSITVELKDGTSLTYAYNPTKKIITVNGARLTSDQVAVQSCSFSCAQTAGQPPIIKIKFRLTQRTQAAHDVGVTPFPEQAAAVDFETSVTLRNQ